MSFLEKIFDNPGIKKAAFAAIKKQMADNQITCGVFSLDADGEVDIKFCKEGMLVIQTEQFNEYQRVYNAWLIGQLAPEKGVQDVG